MDKSIITGLGLTPTGTTLVHTPSTGATPHPVNLYSFVVPIGGVSLSFNALPVCTSSDLVAQLLATENLHLQFSGAFTR